MSYSPAILIMAKAPRAGTVKTRLEPVLGRLQCARLQSLLIRRATELSLEFAPNGTFISFDPLDAKQEILDLVPSGVRVFPQVGGHLGERLSAASEEVLRTHEGPLLVIGTDIPTLTLAHLKLGAEILAQGKDVVFGPAVDGGYYLVGMHKPQPGLFELEAAIWGGPSVLSLSLNAADSAGMQVGLLETLHDLDTPQDAAIISFAPTVPKDIAHLLSQALRTTSKGTLGALS